MYLNKRHSLSLNEPTLLNQFLDEMKRLESDIAYDWYRHKAYKEHVEPVCELMGWKIKTAQDIEQLEIHCENSIQTREDKQACIVGLPEATYCPYNGPPQTYNPMKTAAMWNLAAAVRRRCEDWVAKND